MRYFPLRAELTGELRRRLEVTADKLSSLDLETTFLRPFVDPAAKTTDSWAFIGLGLMLDALVRAASVLSSSELEARKSSLIGSLIAAQETSGRLTIYAPGVDGVWESHESAYLIVALTADYRIFQMPSSLAAAVRLGDYYRSAMVKPANIGAERAFLELYRCTGESRFRDYLEGPLKIAAPIEAYDRMTAVNPIRHVYTFLARAEAQLRYAAQIDDSDPVLFAAAEEALDRLLNRDFCTVAGTCTGKDGTPYFEYWNNSQSGQGGETCGSAYLLRLLALRAGFADSTRENDLAERVLFNALPAAQSPDGRQQRYFTPVNGVRKWYNRDTYCCPNNFRRIMFELPETVFYAGDGVLKVNHLIPGSTDLQFHNVAVKVTLTGDYPFDTTMQLELAVRGEAEFTVKLPVPGWCTGFTAVIDGRKYSAGPGEWLNLSRVWRENTVVSLFLPMAPRILRGRVRQSGKYALARGPLLYGLDLKRNHLSRRAASALVVDTAAPIVFAAGQLRGRSITGNTLFFSPFADPGVSQVYFRAAGPDPVGVEDELFVGRSMTAK